jgi:phosphopantothenoylcysteine decarboxylase/phosphopantothenate--cysteine ligase
MPRAKKITLGVTGSIAAYKAAEIASALTSVGHEVRVIMTEHATRFISPITFETLTRQKVLVDMFSDEDHRQVSHIEQGTNIDLVLVAPATFNIIGKAAQGIADDLLSSVLAAADPKRVLYAPAMNVNMFENPAFQANMATLKDRGSQFVEPEEGMLACGVYAKGRLAKVPAILDAVESFLAPKPLQGKRVLITAGATREYIDPIRFLSNSSSGQMGVALARACRSYGAEVTLLLANSTLDAPGVDVIRVDTVADLYAAALKVFPETDYLFAAAAVSDFKPAARSDSKIKKTGASLNIELVPNTDVLFELSQMKTHQKLIGFAAESEAMLANAKGKLERKKLDWIIANSLDNFARTSGKVWLVDAQEIEELPELPKPELAYAILDALLAKGL